MTIRLELSLEEARALHRVLTREGTLNGVAHVLLLDIHRERARIDRDLKRLGERAAAMFNTDGGESPEGGK